MPTIRPGARRRWALGAIVASVFSLAGAGSAFAETVEPRPEFRVFPESLELPTAQAGDTTSDKATFSNTGNTSLEVKEVHAPSAPFQANGLPVKGTTIDSGSQIIVEVTFKPTSTGQFKSSLSVETTAGLLEVSLSAYATAASSQSTTTPAQPTLPVPSTITGSTGTPGPAPPSPEPPPTLTHLQIHAGTARTGKHARRLAIAYTLSAPGRVDLALERRTVSHRCPRHARSCVRWLATRAKLDTTGHAGHNSATLSLAGLAAGDYRLDATPLARSGAAGAAQRLALQIVG
jgi:hypothetical protein